MVFVIETEYCIRYELRPKEMLTMQRQQSSKTYISLFTSHRFKWMQISCKDTDKTYSVLWVELGKSHCEYLPHWPRFFSKIFANLKCRDSNRERTSKNVTLCGHDFVCYNERECSSLHYFYQTRVKNSNPIIWTKSLQFIFKKIFSLRSFGIPAERLIK